MYIKYFMIATIVYMAASISYAQTIPNPNWPLDSVINQSVHQYSVQGDVNFDEPSSFVWFVEGGRLFFDSGLITMAGDGATATVTGDANNRTTLWVVWDSFDQPLDTGYVYLYEVSADGCERSNSDEGKFQGMRIKVSAPPKVRFISEETITCSNEDGVMVELEIDGMPPFDLKYSLNGVVTDWHILPSDLVDSDFDGLANNVTIPINGYTGTTSDLIYQLELLEASSGGVLGKILPYSSHTVYAFVQPDAPVIQPSITEITTGQQHFMVLTYEGVNVADWFWEVYDSEDNLVYESSSSSVSYASIPFNFPAGDYQVMAYYLSKNGCYSIMDTLAVEIFNLPTLAFADSSDHAMSCSAVSINPDETFEFVLDYKGALAYEFTYGVYDYNGLLLGEYFFDFQTNRSRIISIPNTFINEELPEINRIWKVILLSAKNGEGVPVEILDQSISGGRDERMMIIHPKPIITDDIDFAN